MERLKRGMANPSASSLHEWLPLARAELSPDEFKNIVESLIDDAWPLDHDGRTYSRKFFDYQHAMTRDLLELFSNWDWGRNREEREIFERLVWCLGKWNLHPELSSFEMTHHVIATLRSRPELMGHGLGSIKVQKFLAQELERAGKVYVSFGAFVQGSPQDISTVYALESLLLFFSLAVSQNPDSPNIKILSRVYIDAKRLAKGDIGTDVWSAAQNFVGLIKSRRPEAVTRFPVGYYLNRAWKAVLNLANFSSDMILKDTKSITEQTSNNMEISTEKQAHYGPTMGGDILAVLSGASALIGLMITAALLSESTIVAPTLISGLITLAMALVAKISMTAARRRRHASEVPKTVVEAEKGPLPALPVQEERVENPAPSQEPSPAEAGAARGAALLLKRSASKEGRVRADYEDMDPQREFAWLALNRVLEFIKAYPSHTLLREFAQDAQLRESLVWLENYTGGEISRLKLTGPARDLAQFLETRLPAAIVSNYSKALFAGLLTALLTGMGLLIPLFFLILPMSGAVAIIVGLATGAGFTGISIGMGYGIFRLMVSREARAAYARMDVAGVQETPLPGLPLAVIPVPFSDQAVQAIAFSSDRFLERIGLAGNRSERRAIRAQLLERIERQAVLETGKIFGAPTELARLVAAYALSYPQDQRASQLAQAIEWAQTALDRQQIKPESSAYFVDLAKASQAVLDVESYTAEREVNPAPARPRRRPTRERGAIVLETLIAIASLALSGAGFLNFGPLGALLGLVPMTALKRLVAFAAGLWAALPALFLPHDAWARMDNFNPHPNNLASDGLSLGLPLLALALMAGIAFISFGPRPNVKKIWSNWRARKRGWRVYEKPLNPTHDPRKGNAFNEIASQEARNDRVKNFWNPEKNVPFNAETEQIIKELSGHLFLREANYSYVVAAGLGAAALAAICLLANFLSVPALALSLNLGAWAAFLTWLWPARIIPHWPLINKLHRAAGEDPDIFRAALYRSFLGYFDKLSREIKIKNFLDAFVHDWPNSGPFLPLAETQDALSEMTFNRVRVPLREKVLSTIKNMNSPDFISRPVIFSHLAHAPYSKDEPTVTMVKIFWLFFVAASAAPLFLSLSLANYAYGLLLTISLVAFAMRCVLSGSVITPDWNALGRLWRMDRPDAKLFENSLIKAWGQHFDSALHRDNLGPFLTAILKDWKTKGLWLPYPAMANVVHHYIHNYTLPTQDWTTVKNLLSELSALDERPAFSQIIPDGIIPPTLRPLQKRWGRSWSIADGGRPRPRDGRPDHGNSAGVKLNTVSPDEDEKSFFGEGIREAWGALGLQHLAWLVHEGAKEIGDLLVGLKEKGHSPVSSLTRNDKNKWDVFDATSEDSAGLDVLAAARLIEENGIYLNFSRILLLRHLPRSDPDSPELREKYEGGKFRHLISYSADGTLLIHVESLRHLKNIAKGQGLGLRDKLVQMLLHENIEFGLPKTMRFTHEEALAIGLSPQAALAASQAIQTFHERWRDKLPAFIEQVWKSLWPYRLKPAQTIEIEKKAYAHIFVKVADTRLLLTAGEDGTVETRKFSADGLIEPRPVQQLRALNGKTIRAAGILEKSKILLLAGDGGLIETRRIEPDGNIADEPTQILIAHNGADILDIGVSRDETLLVSTSKGHDQILHSVSSNGIIHIETRPLTFPATGTLLKRIKISPVFTLGLDDHGRLCVYSNTAPRAANEEPTHIVSSQGNDPLASFGVSPDSVIGVGRKITQWKVTRQIPETWTDIGVLIDALPYWLAQAPEKTDQTLAFLIYQLWIDDPAVMKIIWKTLANFIEHGAAAPMTAGPRPLKKVSRPETWSAGAETLIAEHMPTLRALLSDPEKLTRFLSVLSLLRILFPYEVSAATPLAPIEWMKKMGYEFAFHEIRIVPASESFRRHILYVENEHGLFAVELKIPGDQRNIILRKSFDIASALWEMTKEDPLVVRPLYYGQFEGNIPMYGRLMKFPKTAPLGIFMTEYQDGKRLSNMQLPGKIAKNAGGMNMPVMNWWIIQAADAAAGAIALHLLGYHGQHDSLTTDMHME
ncbi:MAG: hypothetical protein HY547_07265, partial [Elusimicrobia bacterium]|nr:hypothetical protein [Elusimicrobiota bacterium]